MENNDARKLEIALGDGIKKIEKNEIETSVVQRRSICANKTLKAGSILRSDDDLFKTMRINLQTL